jgi:hypothetical protein
MPDHTKLTKVVTQCHLELNELFLLHQEAVLLGKFDNAALVLNSFKELHRLHMDFEDEKLIPKLVALDYRGRWPASLYKSEHAKVQDLMGKTEDRLQALRQCQLSSKELRREIIAFLDKEKTFKGVCEHHQEREEAGILPELDQQTDPAWRASIIETFLAEWNDNMERNMRIVNDLDFP